MKTKMILIGLAVLALTASGVLADNPHMGTWKLNEVKSKFAHGSMARNNTVVYEAAGDMIKVTVDGTDATGKHTQNEWTGKFDGKDYPVTGDATSDMRSYRVISANVMEITNKKDGKEVMTGRIVVSANGKKRTVTTHSTDANGKKITNVAVYDKQ
jgi:hypothetical protein